MRTGRIRDGRPASLVRPPDPAVQRALVVSLLALLVAALSLLTALFAAFTPPLPTPETRRAEDYGRTTYDEAALLNHMVNMQRYIEKAALAADAGNWPLTQFYADKIEERAARVVDGGYVVDGIDVSEIAAEVADPRAHALAEAARTEDPALFAEAYRQMVGGCNACHARAGYGVVRIVPPDAARYPSQAFDPPGR